ncbi:hypothetical protein BH11PLA1_BH11PLA1_01460 [soil metagenome]
MTARATTVGVTLLALGFVAWRALALDAAQSAADNAGRDAALAQQALGDIQSLSRLPATALSPTLSDAELLRQLQESLTRAGVAAAELKELIIDGRQDGGAGGTAGVLTISGVIRRTGRFLLEGVTLERVGAALARLRSDIPPLRVEQITLEKMPEKDGQPPVFRLRCGLAALTPTPAHATASPSYGPSR